MNNNRKTGPTPKAPQNRPPQPKLTPEQQERMNLIQEKGEAVLEILADLTIAEAGSVIKTCDNLLQSKVQKILMETKLELNVPREPENAEKEA